MEKRKLTKEDIDKVRDIEGFPIGTDEDIISLSDAPYYTACPNPFIEDFIKEYGTPYDEETDDYHREPFASDVSEGKTDPIYMAHSYHTKVPHKAIMYYILHYTKPNDLILDGFCGTGMTGVAAQECGSKNQSLKYQFAENERKNWGVRKAILSDLSPVATFIAENYNKDVDFENLYNDYSLLINQCEKELGYLYETNHTTENLFGFDKGIINYIVWSDVFICPNCGKEFVFWDLAIENNTVKITLECKSCGAKFKKSDCTRSLETNFDNRINEISSTAKQVPVMINYTYGRKKYNKKPDENDLYNIKRAHDLLTSYWIPSDELPEGDNTEQPKKSHRFTRTHQFYFDRSALIFAYLLKNCEGLKNEGVIKFMLTSILMKTGSKLHNIGFKNGKLNLAGAMPNVLYVPSTIAERNIIELLNGKYKDITKIFMDSNRNLQNVLIQCCSATDLKIPKNSIDYIFTDPPFGSNINYSELNYIWESWLKVKTNNKSEAIMNKTQNKNINDYQYLMEESFKSYYECLKPNRWITVEFHNSQNAVWNAIQEAIQKAGFIIADVRTLDKQQGTFKQMTTTSAVKQDLVISAYKPKDSFKRQILEEAGSEISAWSFVSQYLDNLPVVVIKNKKIELIAERQDYLLFDRMVAYHIMNGLPVPINANEFYNGLDERFIKRDGMYFLANQINEYDTVRIKADVEDIQLVLFVNNEKTAIAWLYQLLDEHNDGPQTYAQIQPKFMQEVKAVEKYESIPELSVLLEENFLKDSDGKWYIPDRTKEADIAKLREKNLLKEFEGYMNSKGKLKLFRSEAIRVGFSKLWKDKNYQGIVDIANRLPESTIQEDQNLLMYYDISLSRI